MRWIHSVTDSYDAESVIPIALVKAELDVTHDEDDAIISGHIAGAIQWVEEYTGRFLGPRTVTFIADRIAGGMINLPFAPVQSVSSVFVGGGAVAGFSSLPGAPELLLPPSTAPWPPYTPTLGAVRVSYVAGYPAGQCPPLLLMAVKLMVGVFYDRSKDPEKDTEAVRNLIRSFRYGIS